MSYWCIVRDDICHALVV